MDKLKDAHFFPLSSQGNIYTLTNLHLAKDTNKLLVASLRREVVYFEYLENAAGVLVPTTKEISFTYIPSGAEIISIDSFNKSETSNDFVIGITIIKDSHDTTVFETFLNIYSESEESVDFNIESISQNCLNIELKFIPYHLTHTHLVTWDKDGIVSKEVVFLLSGSDDHVHVYRENLTNHTYKEIDCKEFFPEFLKPPSIVGWMQVYYFNNYTERLSAFGCECGYVRLCKVSAVTNKMIFNFSTRFDNTISNVQIYPEKVNLKLPSCLKDNISKINVAEDLTLNLVVTNTVLPGVFFKDVLKYGLKNYATLPRHEMKSVLSCIEIADLDFDGCGEILIGTSGQEVMYYKYDDKKGWCLNDFKRFPTPILSMKYCDITGDGVKELVVLSMKGIHILQHDAEFIHCALEKKIKKLNA